MAAQLCCFARQDERGRCQLQLPGGGCASVAGRVADAESWKVPALPSRPSQSSVGSSCLVQGSSSESSLAALAGLPAREEGKQPLQQQEEEDTKAWRQPECPPGAAGVDYQHYRVATFVRLPPLLGFFTTAPGLRNLLVVGRPTFDVSGGLEHYRETCPKRARARAPLLVVLDEPGKAPPAGGKYKWVEFPLPAVYKVDLDGVESMESFLKQLPSAKRRNFRVRQQQWAAKAEGRLQTQYVPLGPGAEKLVSELWPLCAANGERNGLVILDERKFKRVHLQAQGLGVVTVRDMEQDGALVSFSTGVRCGDTLISTWCGTDYSHPLSRACSVYIWAEYEFIKLAIADPQVRWLDLGAQHGTIKRGIGAKPYPVTGYVRCKTAAMRELVGSMMRRYFEPSALLNDP